MGGRTGPVVATVIKILHIAPQVTHPMIGAGVPKKIKAIKLPRRKCFYLSPLILNPLKAGQSEYRKLREIRGMGGGGL